MNLNKPSNPYAPPMSAVEAALPDHCWRDGKILVVPVGNALPPRCVKCNAPAEMDKPRTFAWHHPGWYLFILLNIIVYAVVAMLVQKKAKLALGLCAAHRRRRSNFNWTALGLLVFAFATLFGAMTADEGLLGALSGLCFLAAAIVAIVGARILYPARISKEEARLKGAGPAFLDSLESR
jgi:hypothetical protein